MTVQEPDERIVRRAKKTVRVKKKKQAPSRKKKFSPTEKARMEEVEQKKQQALELRMAGTSYRDIAQALGYYDASHAKKMIDSALSKVQVDAAKEVVAMDLARLDEMQMRATHALRQNGDLNQVERIMRLMEFRYRLLGLTDETVRALQSEHGIHTTTNNTNNVMVVQAAPETEKEYIEKMMKAVGVKPDSEEAQTLLRQYRLNAQEEENEDGSVVRALPLLEGSANDAENHAGEKELPAADIVDAEIVE